MNQLTVSAALIGPGDHVVVELSLPNDNDITPIVGDLRAALSEVPSVFGLRGDNSAGRLEHKLFMNDEARIYGLTLQDLAQQTRARFFGIEATTVQHGAENVAGIVQFAKEERNSLYDLLDTLIATAAGDLIPLGNVARIEEAIAPTQILRRDGRQITTVTGDLDTGISSAGQVNGLITAEIIHGLVAKYLDLIVAIGGEQREQGDAQSALGTALFVIYAPFGASVPVLRPADCGDVGDAARPCWCGGRPLHQRHTADDPVGLRYHRFGRRRHQQQPCYGGCLQRTYPSGPGQSARSEERPWRDHAWLNTEAAGQRGGRGAFCAGLDDLAALVFGQFAVMAHVKFTILFRADFLQVPRFLASAEAGQGLETVSVVLRGWIPRPGLAGPPALFGSVNCGGSG